AADLRRALDLSGGLTLKTSLSDVALRSDLAQAMLLLGKRDEARKYLAYTGAGRIEESPFASATYMGVPSCTGEPGLRPEDSTVVEFSIDAEGHVGAVQTVYSRGTFAAARVFAEEVRDWTWSQKSIAKMPLFYRSLIRAELHCTMASGGVTKLISPLYNRFYSWAGPIAKQGLAKDVGLAALTEDLAPDDGAPLTAARKLVIEKLHAAGSQHLAAGRTLEAGAAIGLAGLYANAANARAFEDLAQAISLIAAADPRRSDPATVPALAALRYFYVANSAAAAAAARKQGRSRESFYNQFQAGLLAGLKDPLISADALALDTLKVAIAAQQAAGSLGPEQTALLRAVADDTRLEEGHPVRQIALLRLASVAAAAKQYQEAQALFTRTGLTEQQCSLIGDVPKLKSNGATSDDYPMAALEMGFEGWVKVEYDIDAAGRTANQRALIAYPPFVFVDAAKSLARGIRYDTAYRPSGQLACSATSETVSFVIPSNH
uniref:energy transducer TonB n=1 Tax=Novosphingobium sp. TaxID=1874826 RepID=UPI00262103A8